MGTTPEGIKVYPAQEEMGKMAAKQFKLIAAISKDGPAKIKKILPQVLKGGSFKKGKNGSIITAKMPGETAWELNRKLLSALRAVVKKTRLRAEWTCGNGTERFFDYVPKGKTKRIRT